MVLFTTAVQIEHLTQVAMGMGIEEAVFESLRKSQDLLDRSDHHGGLEEFGIHPSMEPSHPKLGILIRGGRGD